MVLWVPFSLSPPLFSRPHTLYLLVFFSHGISHCWESRETFTTLLLICKHKITYTLLFSLTIYSTVGWGRPLRDSPISLSLLCSLTLSCHTHTRYLYTISHNHSHTTWATPQPLVFNAQTTPRYCTAILFAGLAPHTILIHNLPLSSSLSLHGPHTCTHNNTIKFNFQYPCRPFLGRVFSFHLFFRSVFSQVVQFWPNGKENLVVWAAWSAWLPP